MRQRGGAVRVSKTAQVIMWLIVAAVIVAILRNAAGAVGVILAGGDESAAILNTLAGGNGPRASKGKFSTSSGTKIQLGRA